MQLRIENGRVRVVRTCYRSGGPMDPFDSFLAVLMEVAINVVYVPARKLGLIHPR